MGDDCTPKGLARALNKCKYARGPCADDFDVVNMLAAQYCYVGDHSVLGVLLGIGLLCLFMRHIEHVSGDYLSVAIAALSNGLGLSELVAGSTLLALSNGATDLITAMVSASSSGGEGFDIVIGSLFGASLFSILCIFAAVIWASAPGSNLKECGLMTNIKIWVVADVVLFLGLIAGAPAIFFSVMFLGIYYFYIRQVFKQEAKNKTNSLEEKSQNELTIQGTILKSEMGANESTAATLAQSESTEAEQQENFEQSITGVVTKDESLIANESGLSTDSNNVARTTANSSFEEPQSEQMVQNAPNPFEKLVHRLKFEISQQEGVRSALYLVETSMRLVTAFVVPAIETPMIEGLPTLLFCFTIPLFYLGANNALKEQASIPGLEIEIPKLLIGLAITLASYKAIKPNYRRILFSIGGSVIVLDYFVGAIVDILNFARIQFGISSFFLALTILGVANSIVDLFVDRSLAVAGLTTMAVTGVFSGQLFNFLIGMSITGLLQTVFGHANPVSLLDETAISKKKCFMICFVIGLHILLLIGIALYLSLRNWATSTRLAYLLSLTYGALLATLVVMETFLN